MPKLLRSPHPRRARLLSVALTTAALSLVGAASAGAASEIEGIWSFNGGEVAIHSVAGGKFTGIVVTPTKFSECTHQTGEPIWTNVTPQPDGSYWGSHQWLFEKTCEPNPELGPTAWRVLPKANGSHDLLVCFSEPGGPQPTIAPNGAAAQVTRSCEESAPTAPLPIITTGNNSKGNGSQGAAERIRFATTIVLPKATACVKQGSLKIKVRDPKYDPLKEVVVKIKRHTVADVKGIQRLQHAAILLLHLPRGSYTIKITAITVLDQKLTGQRTYHACTRRSSKLRLHRRKHS